MAPDDGFSLTLLAGAPVEPEPRLKEFLRCWRGARGDRAMPRRKDIDPTAFPPRLLPFLMLVDVVDGGARFRFRLVGTGAVAAIGEDLTGRHVDEVNQSVAYRDYITELYRRVLETRRPLFSASGYMRPGDPDAPRHTTQRLMCPLSTDDHAVDMVILCQTFAQASFPSEFPRLTADNPFVRLCEALVD